MARSGQDDAGKLVLRIALGGLMLFHGLSKLVHGVQGIAHMLAAHGVPGWVSLGVYVGEVIAPLLVVLGVITRPAAAVIAFNMMIALAMVHVHDFQRLDPHGGWAIELPVLYLSAAVALVFLGAGEYSVTGSKGRWN